ncbi:MAG: hypothetical protein K2I09_02270, partial [Duncaniella sp.]|nr:hypothetical protein [Duncaniella sp.]
YKGLHDTYADLCHIRSDYAYMFDKDTSCRLDLNSVTARYISLVSGTSELYLVVNPAVSGTADVMPVHPVTGAAVDLSSYELIAASFNTTPTISGKGVNLPGGTFAVYGKDLKSGIDDITASSTTGPQFDVTDGIVTPRGDYDTFTIHTLTGISLPVGSTLTPGLYIITIDGKSMKLKI